MSTEHRVAGHLGVAADDYDRTIRAFIPNYERMIATPQWLALAAFGARPQRPLWASTSVKDPAYPDTRYVDELVVAGSVNTMPEKTLDAVADHGAVRGDTVTNVTKPATLETGAVVQVPLFVDTGETIKVDPREGRYISRA